MKVQVHVNEDGEIKDIRLPEADEKRIGRMITGVAIMAGTILAGALIALDLLVLQ